MQQLQNQKHYKFWKDLTISFFVITRFVAISFSFPSFSDTLYYFGLFLKAQVDGLHIYQDFNFEYPPLAILPIYFPKLILTNFTFPYYFVIYALLMFAADCLCLVICRFFCRNRLEMNEMQINKMTMFYALFGLILFRLLYHRLDVIVALFIVGSLALFCAKKKEISYGFFVNSFFGFFYKIVPVFNLPAAIMLKAFMQKNPVKKIIYQSLIFTVLVAVTVFAIEIYTNHSFLKNILIQGKRTVQIESFFGSLLLFQALIINVPAHIYSQFGGWNIASSPTFEIIAKLCGILSLAGFYMILFIKLFRKKNISEEIFFEITLVIILLTLSFQKVLSPQFFIWLIPLAAIWLAKNRSVINLIIFSFLFFATFFIFSIDYFALINQAPILVVMLFLRNLVLVTFTCLLTFKLCKKLS